MFLKAEANISQFEILINDKSVYSMKQNYFQVDKPVSISNSIVSNWTSGDIAAIQTIFEAFNNETIKYSPSFSVERNNHFMIDQIFNGQSPG